ncbi:MAG: peptidase U62 [Candidatus Solibacter sp.]|nr:peptidase U62 [Candidatus Solibacter sp.]
MQRRDGSGQRGLSPDRTAPNGCEHACYSANVLRKPLGALGVLTLYALTQAPGALSSQGAKDRTAPARPALAQILSSELNRNLEGLSKAEPAAYYISYQVTEVESHDISAGSGSLQGSSSQRRRRLDVSVRVGSPKFDNYRVSGGERQTFSASAELPLEDGDAAVRRILWRETDRAWRVAAQRYIKVKSATGLAVSPAEVPDFSAEKPVTGTAVAPPGKLNVQEWENRLRKHSAATGVFGVITATVALNARSEHRTMVDSEGTSVSHGRGFARWGVVARAKAHDGQDLVSAESFDAADPAALPKDDVLIETARKTAVTVSALLKAPPVDPYVGPAVLSGRAAGVFFHEIFGHRVEGHRQKDETEGQTFTNSLNKQVLPPFLSVVFDPTRKSAAGADLNGWYAFDDEGRPAQPVRVVENGTLKSFLVSREPIASRLNSNGHGRRQPGYEAVARQSNLIVESARRVSDEQLRRMLIEEVIRQGKPYGLYFDTVTGGYTTTRRRGLQAFTVVPLVVYRIYPNRPPELVRGVDIVGTPLASFEKILATGDKDEVFNGYCGAESGQVPVSAVSPALLVSEIEVQRKPTQNDRPPLLPRPMISGGAQ